MCTINEMRSMYTFCIVAHDASFPLPFDSKSSRWPIDSFSLFPCSSIKGSLSESTFVYQIMTEIKEHIYRYRHYIGVAAAVALVCQQVYYRIFRIPKNLRHIPAIPYGQQLKALRSDEALTSRTKRLVFPLLSKCNGVYLVCFLIMTWLKRIQVSHTWWHVLESNAFQVDDICGRSWDCQGHPF